MPGLDIVALEPARVLYPVPETVQVECGYLPVPASRVRANSSSIKLYTTVIKSRNPNPSSDPIIWLNGGPGENSREAIELMGGPVGDHLLADRDLIVFDQRGAGKSIPSLLCPELDEYRIQVATTTLPAAERSRLYLEAAFKARDRFVSQGIDLQDFNTVENAADVNDLREALSLQQVNLLGQSYGTRLALTTMKNHPWGIRSVILDSILPLQVDIYADALDYAARSFETLFRDCQADENANRAYPNVRQIFYDLIATLNASPQIVPVAHPQTDQLMDVYLTGDVLVGIIFVELYQNSSVPGLPRLIYQVHNHEFSGVADRMAGILKAYSDMSWGLQYSVFSQDQGIGPATAEAIAAAARRHPEIGPLSSWVTPWLSDHIVPLAKGWGAMPEAPPCLEPVRSSLPALLLAGEYDQSTPAVWAKQAHKSLPHSFYFEFPGLTHGVITGGQCVLDVIDSFLSNPREQPDHDCVSRMGPPVFELA